MTHPEAARPERGSEPAVYQLRGVVHDVSPLIWRRLLIPGATTIAELHAILQIAFGWADAYLHRFLIHGRKYGIVYDGGPLFREDARTVHLADLGLRERERFSYEYNFFAPWQVDLRVEAIRPAEPSKTYPRCIGGRRAGPPEQWRGPWEFCERTQPYRVFDATLRAAGILREILDANKDDGLSLVYDHYDELAELTPLLGLEVFDRRACNKALVACLTGQNSTENKEKAV